MKKYYSSILNYRDQKIKRIMIFKKTSEKLEYGTESIIYEDLGDKGWIDYRYQMFDTNLLERVIKTSKPARINQIFLFKINKEFISKPKREYINPFYP